MLADCLLVFSVNRTVFEDAGKLFPALRNLYERSAEISLRKQHIFPSLLCFRNCMYGTIKVSLPECLMNVIIDNVYLQFFRLIIFRISLSFNETFDIKNNFNTCE